MQLNGIGTIMAASEPPEPPPRNPDKINASLKQLADQKAMATKSLDTGDSKAPKLFKSILSLDNTAQQQQQSAVCTTTTPTGGRQPEKSPTTDTAAATANQSTGGELRGAASTLFSAATTTISNKINELVNGSIAITGGGIGQYTENVASNRNETKASTPVVVVAAAAAVAPTSTTTVSSTVELSGSTNNGSGGDYANGDTLNSIDQKNLVFPNESASVFVERRQSTSESGSGSRKSREFDELGKLASHTHTKIKKIKINYLSKLPYLAY